MGMAIKAHGKWKGAMGTAHLPWSECDVFKPEKQDGFGKQEQRVG